MIFLRFHDIGTESIIWLSQHQWSKSEAHKYSWPEPNHKESRQKRITSLDALNITVLFWLWFNWHRIVAFNNENQAQIVAHKTQ